MEITLNIPQNDYVEPTEVRQDVVQAICDWFLRGEHCVYHPVSDGCYRQADYYVRRKIGTQAWCPPCDWRLAEEKGYEKTVIRGVEVKAAFDALIRAGYHMFRVYEYGSWMGYCCSKKPVKRGCTPVSSFDDFID